jgi:hypothetical protein
MNSERMRALQSVARTPGVLPNVSPSDLAKLLEMMEEGLAAQGSWERYQRWLLKQRDLE